MFQRYPGTRYRDSYITNQKTFRATYFIFISLIEIEKGWWPLPLKKKDLHNKNPISKQPWWWRSGWTDYQGQAFIPRTYYMFPYQIQIPLQKLFLKQWSYCARGWNPQNTKIQHKVPTLFTAVVPTVWCVPPTWGPWRSSWPCWCCVIMVSIPRRLLDGN